MRKSKIILILLLSITMTSSIATTGFSSEITPKNNTIKETKLINEKDVLEKLDNFVCYDNATKSFSIKDGAKESLTDKEYETLSNYIKAGITFLASGMNIGFSGVQNIRFQ